MSSSGVRNTGRTVWLNVVVFVPAGKVSTTVVAHCFNIYAFITCSWISVVNPEEGTDLHFVCRLLNNFIAVSSYINDFCRSQFMFISITQIHISKVFERKTVSFNRAFRILFNTNVEGGASHLIPGTVNSFWSCNQHSD